MSDGNKAIARRIFDEVWGAHRVDKVDDYFAADFVNHPETPGVPQGSEGIKTLTQMFEGAFEDEYQVIEDMIAEGDEVAIRWSSTPTHTGPYLGIPATGKQVHVTAITIYRFKDGKAVEGWSEYNSVELMQELGAITAMAG